MMMDVKCGSSENFPHGEAAGASPENDVFVKTKKEINDEIADYSICPDFRVFSF